MNKKTLIVLLDAFRSDYLTEENTPFLWSMLEEGVYVKDLFNNGGYCERSCQFCGVKPETSDEYFAMALMPTERQYIRPYYEPTFNVPKEIRDRLVMTEDQTVDFEPNSFKHESIWDVMRKEGVSFEFRACYALGVMSHKGQTTHGSRPMYLKNSDKDVLYMQISEVDNYAHKYGCDSPEMKGILRWADAQIEMLYEHHNYPNLIVWGDHGMMDIDKKLHVPVEAILHGFKLGWDYLYLKSSAAIQFWFWNKRAEKIIQEHPLFEKEGDWIPSPTPRQGHAIWNVKPATLISPCHFHQENDGTVAMHGYDMIEKYQTPEMYGTALIVDGKHKGQLERAELIDMAETITDVIGIRAPKKNEGLSILQRL